jgi:hypothetical protein
MTTTVLEYRRIISDVAKQIDGGQCKEINYGQLTDIITSLYGDKREGYGNSRRSYVWDIKIYLIEQRYDNGK